MIHFAVFHSKYKPKEGKLYKLPPKECALKFFNNCNIREDNLIDRDGPAFSLAHYTNIAYENTVARSDDNIEGAYGVVFDIDCEEGKPIYTIGEAKELFQDYLNVIYTTYSNTKELPRFRIVLFFNSMVAKKDWTRVYNHLRKMLPEAAPVDKQSAVLAQQWFMHECAKSEFKDAYSKVNSGMLLNLEEILKSAVFEDSIETFISKGDQTVLHQEDKTHLQRTYGNNSTKNMVVNSNLHNSVNFSLTNNDDYYLDSDEPLSERVFRVLQEPAMHVANFHYSDWIRIGSAIKGAGLSYILFRDWSAADSSKFKERECQKKWDGFDGSASAGTIFEIAKNQGVQKWLGYSGEKKTPSRRQPDNIVIFPGATKVEMPAEEEPKPREEKQDDEHDFPIDLCNRAPEPVRLYMDYVLESSTHPNPIYALANAISSLGFLYHQRIRGSYKKCCTNMYILSLAGSGQGKSQALECQDFLFNKLGYATHMIQTPQSTAGLLTSLRAREGNLFMQIDEFEKSFLKHLSNKNIAPHMAGISAELMKLYTVPHKPYLSNATYADEEKNKKLEGTPLINPHLSMYGTCVPDDFYKHYSGDMGQDGFLARIMPFANKYFFPEKVKNMYVKDSENIPDKLLNFCLNIKNKYPIHKLGLDLDMRIRPTIINFEDSRTEDYYDEFSEYMRLKGHKLGLKGEIVASASTNRIAENGYKIALASHVGNTVTYDVLEWSFEVSKVLTENVLHKSLYNKVESKSEAEIVKLERIILNAKGWITLQDLADKFRLIAEKRDPMLKYLVEAGKIVEDTYVAPRAKRPTRRFMAI